MGSKYSMYSRELFDRYVINVLRLRTDFSVTGSDKGVKFSWKHTIQISDRRLLLALHRILRLSYQFRIELGPMQLSLEGTIGGLNKRRMLVIVPDCFLYRLLFIGVI
jgi:hypothetical protein